MRELHLAAAIPTGLDRVIAVVLLVVLEEGGCDFTAGGDGVRFWDDYALFSVR